MENFKQEIAKNKEMKENLKKFRQEAEKLEHSEALKKARFCLNYFPKKGVWGLYIKKKR